MLKQSKSPPCGRFGYQILISIDCDHFISSFTPLLFALIEKKYQTLKTVFQVIYQKRVRVFRQGFQTPRK